MLLGPRGLAVLRGAVGAARPSKEASGGAARRSAETTSPRFQTESGCFVVRPAKCPATENSPKREQPQTDHSSPPKEKSPQKGPGRVFFPRPRRGGGPDRQLLSRGTLQTASEDHPKDTGAQKTLRQRVGLAALGLGLTALGVDLAARGLGLGGPGIDLAARGWIWWLRGWVWVPCEGVGSGGSGVGSGGSGGGSGASCVRSGGSCVGPGGWESESEDTPLPHDHRKKKKSKVYI